MLLVTTYDAVTRSARDLFWTFLFQGFPAAVLSPDGDPLYPPVQPAVEPNDKEDQLRVVPDTEGCDASTG